MVATQRYLIGRYLLLLGAEAERPKCEEFTMILMPVLLLPLSLLGSALKGGNSHGGHHCKPEPAKPCKPEPARPCERTIHIETTIKY